MRRVLDPYLRGDLLIVPLLTPHDVIDQIVRFGQPPRPIRTLPRSGRPSRVYLRHPTLVESRVEPRRWAGYGLGGAATTVTTLGLLYLVASPDSLKVAHLEPPPVLPTTVVPSVAAPALTDGVTHAAMVHRALDWDTLLEDEVEIEDEVVDPRPSTTPTTVRPRRPRAEPPAASDVFDRFEEEILILEDDEPAVESRPPEEPPSDPSSETSPVPPRVPPPPPDPMPTRRADLDERSAAAGLDDLPVLDHPPVRVEDVAAPPASATRAVTFDPFADPDHAVPTYH
jgi:hypothetical protein